MSTANGHTSAMTPRIRAEYDAEMARTRRAERFVPKPPPPRRRPPDATAKLARRLLALAAADSTVDRERHALAVARMIFGAAGKSRLG